MKELIELTTELNEYAKNYTNENEIITNEDIILAVYYLNNLFVEDEIGVLVFLSSINLCNAYVKQNKDNISYSFKKSIGTLAKIVNDYKFNNLKIYETNNNGNLFIFELGNIQFSFHDEKKVEINEIYYQELKWDGIRKQPCAKSLFYKIINNNLSEELITMNGENIHLKSKELLTNYKENKISFEDIINYYV